MKKFLAILLILAFLLSGCIGQGADQRPEKVSTLVKEASVMIQEKGEDAFPQIREKGKFYTDDTYVFVWKVEGCKITRVVFPPDLAQEGTDVSDFKDDNNVSITEPLAGFELSLCERSPNVLRAIAGLIGAPPNSRTSVIASFIER